MSFCKIALHGSHVQTNLVVQRRSQLQRMSERAKEKVGLSKLRLNKKSKKGLNLMNVSKDWAAEHAAVGLGEIST